MKCLRTPLIILFASTVLSNFAFPWGANGHRITAQIGQNHLSEKSQKAVEELLGSASLAQVATWPDYIRSEKKWDFAKDWHFLTVDDDEFLEDVLKEANSGDKEKSIDNVVEAIEYFSDILAGDTKKLGEFKDLLTAHGVEPHRSPEATALIFLVHFVGDVHQPLHVGRSNDYGGNTIKVLWFGEESNLHSVWDEGLIENEGLSFTEFSKFIDQVSKDDISKWQKSKPAIWAQESIDYRPEVYHVTLELGQKPEEIKELSYQFAHDKIPIIKERLKKGGIRLAGRLNSIFK